MKDLVKKIRERIIFELRHERWFLSVAICASQQIFDVTCTEGIFSDELQNNGKMIYLRTVDNFALVLQPTMMV